jgi:hypothetical protein
MAMSRTERSELKSVVRNQFKVLRKEVEQRRDELLAEAYAEIERRTEEDEALRAAIEFEVAEAVGECNRMINDILKGHGLMHADGREREFVTEPHLWGPRYSQTATKKDQLSHAAQLDLQAHVRDAMNAIDRQEADLLRDLAVGALESEEARAFLSQIPTVGQLVPRIRMAEIEAALQDLGVDEEDE